MERRTFMAMIAGSLLAAPLAAGAQPAGKVVRVGVPIPGTRSELGGASEGRGQGSVVAENEGARLG